MQYAKFRPAFPAQHLYHLFSKRDKKRAMQSTTISTNECDDTGNVWDEKLEGFGHGIRVVVSRLRSMLRESERTMKVCHNQSLAEIEYEYIADLI